MKKIYTFRGQKAKIGLQSPKTEGRTPKQPVSKRLVMKIKNPIWPAPTHPKPKQPISKQPKFKILTIRMLSVKKSFFVVTRLYEN
jgi:hypothetical protein